MTDLKNQTLKSVLERSAEDFAERPALGFVGKEAISFSDFYERVKAVSALLMEEGVGFGDKVAIFSENKPNWGIAFFAITSMGAVAVPILPDFHESAVHHILRHAECKVLFASDKLVSKLDDQVLEKLNAVYSIEDFSPQSESEAPEFLREAVRTGKKKFSEWKDSALRLAGKINEDVNEDDLASIIYTSGTTGHSKGVMLTHKNLVFCAEEAARMVSITSEERMLSILPLAHTYECTLGLILPVTKGICVRYMEKPPTPTVLLEALQEVKPTFVLSVPLIIEKIFKKRIQPSLTRNKLFRMALKSETIRKKLHKIAGKKLMESFGGSLKCFCIGGAPLAPEVEFFLREAEFPYAIGYGMTETSPILAGAAPDKTKYRATGPAIDGVELKIHNPDPKTGEGEIWARGPNVMHGYYKAPVLTEEVLTEDGWLKTGDLGVFDEDGYLYIKGRSKNMILGPSGENIYPEEIEAVMNEFEIVQESLVYEQDKRLVARVHLDYDKLDELYGDLKEIESKLREKTKGLLEEIKGKLNSKIARYCRISQIIEQREPFEKTPTQKIKRFLYIQSPAKNSEDDKE